MPKNDVIATHVMYAREDTRPVFMTRTIEHTKVMKILFVL